MTTSLPPRGPSPFNPGATTSQPKTSNVSFASSQPGRTKSRTENRRNTADSESNDTSGDRSTVALIRRVLCPDVSTYGSSAPRPLQELLPPLTSSNDVDLQLYALTAVIIKEFVYSWYARITPDHFFVDEVLQLIAHCTRALEQRLRRVDVGQLVLDEVTGLVHAHITAYRIATQGSDLVAVKPSAREIYHHLNPHPGLSPVPNVSTPSRSSEQQNNENLYRHLLAQGVLAVLLPTEDLENVCLRTLVEDVLSDLILGNQVSGRICEGWFIWTAISKVITMAKQRDSVTTVTVGQSLDAVADLNRLERFGLLSEDGNEDRNAQKHRRSTASLWLWKILYSVYLTYVTMRFVIGGLLHTALSNPVFDIPIIGGTTENAMAKWFALVDSEFVSGRSWQDSNDVSPSFQQPQQGQPLNGTDHQTVIDNSDIKDASTPAPGGNTPSPSEIAVIKRQCATDILSLIPESVARAFFRGNAENQVNDYRPHDRNESSHNETSPFTSKGSSQSSTADTEDLLETIESDLLDPFSDAYCNKHLIYAIVELVLIKLIPELSEQSVSSLMEERGIVK
ncbi:uncharacterized protein BHQ10_000357 [Talaromyces amestolkiae]|uniref:PXA domain-containing protein n=1 Tax=Talaromyces amestolkiae TaxID=1196081 RepID=A0A364KLC0_TALAM|nr:uncharacterized protein BHQ10_000357 [Talaromyces amestolkiae]RAO64345.1 hypothetical protein BHQ10_000357 [Talaromyces amestolkiae]